MKKIIIFALIGVMSLFLPVIANASEISSEDNTQTEENSIEEVIEVEEQTVRAQVVDVTQPSDMENTNSDEYWKEHKAKVDNSKQTELTQEQIDNGYTLIDGIAYSPEEQVGDKTSETMAATANITGPAGYLTIQANPISTIHETCFVTIMNIHTYEEYTFSLYEVNKFSSSAKLPIGDYIITDGGIPNDFKHEYPYETESFTLSENATKVINFKIGKESQVSKIEENTEISTEEKANVETINKKEIYQTDNKILNVFLFIIDCIWTIIKRLWFTVILLIIVIKLYKKKKSKKNDEDE